MFFYFFLVKKIIQLIKIQFVDKTNSLNSQKNKLNKTAISKLFEKNNVKKNFYKAFIIFILIYIYINIKKLSIVVFHLIHHIKNRI